jgi:hypothetical protein
MVINLQLFQQITTLQPFFDSMFGIDSANLELAKERQEFGNFLA